MEPREFLKARISNAKIACCGTHSTGKTTLTKDIARMLNLTPIFNTTRKVPLELRGTPAGQDEIMALYLSVMPEAGGWISDRSLIDALAYSAANNTASEEHLNWLAKHIFPHILGRPDFLLYFPMDDVPYVQDGERPSAESRGLVDHFVRHFAVKSGLPIYNCKGVSSMSKLNSCLDIIDYHYGKEVS